MHMRGPLALATNVFLNPTTNIDPVCCLGVCSACMFATHFAGTPVVCTHGAVNVTGPKNAFVCSDSTVTNVSYNVSSGKRGVVVARVTAVAVGAAVQINCTVSPFANGGSPQDAGSSLVARSQPSLLQKLNLVDVPRLVEQHLQSTRGEAC